MGEIVSFPGGREPLLTRKELLRELRCSEWWLREQESDPSFPRHRWSKKMFRYRYSEVLAYLDNRDVA